MKKLTLTITFFCLFLSAFSQYSGGTGGGSYLVNLVQTNCQPIDDGTFFYGGNGGGAALANLTLSNCQPIDDGTFFYGGNGGGATLANLTLSNCQPLDDGTFFYGGNGDGAASAAIGICAPYSAPPPTAQFSVSDSTLCVGDTVTFTDLSTESPNQWHWQFNGGNITTSTVQNPTVIYTTAGTYPATLIATNNFGADTLVKTTYITVLANPVPSISTSGNTSICQGSSVTLTSSTTSGNTWSNNAITQSITVTTAGSYTVTANNGTCSASSLPTVVTVNNTPSTPALIVGDTSGCSSSNYSFSVTSVSGATSYTWILPPGWSGTSTTNSITATSATSNGIISVTANNSCGSSASQTKTVNVQVVDTSVTDMGGMFMATAFADSYQWINCGNNSPISGATSDSYMPINAGSYAVVVTQNGCTDTSSCYSFMSTNVLKGEIPTINLYPNPSKGKFTIEVNAVLYNSAFEIYTVLGEKVFKSTLEKVSTDINLENTSKGLYMLKIHQGNNVYYKKLVIE